jgi:hypothetical protein
MAQPLLLLNLSLPIAGKSLVHPIKTALGDLRLRNLAIVDFTNSAEIEFY